MQTIKRRLTKLLTYSFEILCLILLYPWCQIKRKKEDIYIISERGHEARDNGLYMFRYYRQNHPEKKVYYVIDKNSEDINNVKALGNLVYHGSLKHRIIFFSAKYCISTHILGYTPNIDFYISLLRKGHLKNKQYVSLRHGISENCLVGLFAENAHLSAMMCGALPEYKYIIANYHYKPEQIKFTGLARYDGLLNCETKKQILVMPTWRNYLYLENDENFTRSDYFLQWNGLINDKRIIELLKATGYQLIFYPHYELQKYTCLFDNKENVIIANKKLYDVQQLLKESALLITDYSSVFFDFAYMKKPCILYQFDKDVFYTQHYKQGYLGEDKMGIVDVTDDYNELIKLITGYFNNGFAIPAERTEKIKSFFSYYDGKNCERIYEEIEKLD